MLMKVVATIMLRKYETHMTNKEMVQPNLAYKGGMKPPLETVSLSIRPRSHE